ncbi:hypothetical protein AGMMS50293_27700 [Spirochaetia bacterium]|nr:hypothetical protein AGMMS50293_27700 [Spirochaetia bacterium]
MKSKLTCLFGVLVLLLLAITGCPNPAGDDTPPPISVTGVSISPASPAAIGMGGTVQLTATVSPADAANKGVSWESDKPAIATVNTATGLVTGVAAGTAKIKVTTTDGSKTDEVTVTVDASVVLVTGVSINPASPAAIGIGGTVQLAAAVSPGNATNKEVSWQSLNTAIATVNASTGLVTGVAAGTATIKVTTADGGKTDEVTVTVDAGIAIVHVDSVSISPAPPPAILIGATVQLSAEVTPSNASNKGVSWESLHPAIATVNDTGLVTGVASGTATIKVTTADGAKTDEVTVTVNASAYTLIAANISNGIYANVRFYVAADGTMLNLVHDSLTYADIEFYCGGFVSGLAVSDVGRFLYAVEFSGNGSGTPIKAGKVTIASPLSDTPVIDLTNVPGWFHALTADSVSGEGTFGNVFFFLGGTNDMLSSFSQSLTVAGLASYSYYIGNRLDSNRIEKDAVAGDGKYLYALEFTGTSSTSTLLKMGVSASKITTYDQARGTDIVILSDAPWEVPDNYSQLGSDQIENWTPGLGNLVFYVSEKTTDEFTTVTTRPEVELHLEANAVMTFTNADAGKYLWAVVYDGPQTVLKRGNVQISTSYATAKEQKVSLAATNPPVPSAAVTGSPDLTIAGYKYNNSESGGGDLIDEVTFTINLTNAQVVTSLYDTDITSWFSNPAPGLTYTGFAGNFDTSIVVTIAGTFTAAKTGTSTITIPDGEDSPVKQVVNFVDVNLSAPLVVDGGTITYNVTEEATWELGLDVIAYLPGLTGKTAQLGYQNFSMYVSNSRTILKTAKALLESGDYMANKTISQVEGYLYTAASNEGATLTSKSSLKLEDLAGGVHLYIVQYSTTFGFTKWIRVGPLTSYSDIMGISGTFGEGDFAD